MNRQAQAGARLLFRVEPLPFESPHGYLCRTAQTHGYRGARWLAAIAGVPPTALDREDRVRQIAHVLRLEPEEWLAMCYHPVEGQHRYAQRSFHGEPIGIDHLNYGCPRVCPSCLREQPVWWAVWDLALVTACPMHRGLLVNQCPACNRRLAWYRPAVHECRCGLDFRDLTTDVANDDLLMINAMIYRASGVQCDEAAEKESNRYHFPPEMAHLRLSSLLSLVQFVGCAGRNGLLRWKQRRLASTDLATVTTIGKTAAEVLTD
jgi:hypothetical protein